MISKIKSMLQQLASQLEVDFEYLAGLTNNGSQMLFNESIEDLSIRLTYCDTDDDLIEEILIGCAYGASLDKLVLKIN